MNLSFFSGTVISNVVVGNDNIMPNPDIKCLYLLRIKDNNLDKTIDVYLPQASECNYNTQDVCIFYYEKDGLFFAADIEIIKENKTPLSIVPIAKRKLQISGVFSRYEYTINVKNEHHINIVRVIHEDYDNRHIDYNKETYYLFNMFKNTCTLTSQLKILTSHFETIYDISHIYPDFVINDGKLYLSKKTAQRTTFFDKDISEPLSFNDVSLILNDKNNAKEVSLKLAHLKNLGVFTEHSESKPETLFDQNKKINEQIEHSLQQKISKPFITKYLAHFIIKDATIHKSNPLNDKEKIIFSVAGSTFLYITVFKNSKLKKLLSELDSDKRALLIFNAELTEDTLCETPLFAITPKGIVVLKNKATNRLTLSLKYRSKLKAIQAEYIKHLSDEKNNQEDTSYYTKKIVCDYIKEDSKDKRSTKKEQTALEYFISANGGSYDKSRK